MNTYISILRGINVSGQRKIMMADLKSLYERLGFQDVVTYIQSGNVVFSGDAALASDETALLISRSIHDTYGFDVPVIVRTPEAMEQTLNGNPFLLSPGSDPGKLHVTFLSDQPLQANVDKIAAMQYPPDQFILAGKDIYLHCPGGYGNTKLSNNFFESKLKVTATTRNWATVNKLAEIARGLRD